MTRGAMDTCFSIYAKHFPGSLPYAYDLESLGGYYKLYEQIIAHWSTAVPGQYLDLSYEDLIKEPEAQIRRLLDYCDLTFVEDCLNFHQTKRTVQTASAAQVRQPVYTSSIGRWRRFETLLEPLKQIVSP
ncbi:MAG: sulfotransferase [Rhodospirillales bacterium]|nr:sulfotransferase [Rhodospirillales bacterium]MBT4625906.1 sulfotransferase [Rhodospirillales bacterium]MBT5352342.1 sulfotransferase [Rhodospirillales bacterium]MBT5519667.1 sulfotransferase [Rhodospirillales bacterium]MBT6111651.1 sulfotransferase [Rhodospirillales bacterium]